jgi:pyruvate formate lyase activating enzyme
MSYHPTAYWHKLEDGRVQCDVCPRACQMTDGQRGLCFVRMNKDNALVLTSYGRSSGFCIDPIEKKPLNHFYPGTSVLSFGTAGCNLTCSFCQNWDMSKARNMDRMQDKASPEAIARAAAIQGCESVAFTYNDPVIFMEYAIDAAQACYELGINSVAVTAGYISPDARKEFFHHMDAANVDLKGFTESFYKKVCGGELAAVLDTLLYLKQETDVWFELTTLLIPDENDSEAEIEEMTQWVFEHLGPDIPMHFSAFHPDFRMLDKQATPRATLLRARDIALKNGIRHVFTGNIHDKESQSSYCHSCGALLIGRDWYELSDWTLTQDGRCQNCKSEIAGHFSPEPGTWGSRRQTIHIGDYSE